MNTTPIKYNHNFWKPQTPNYLPNQHYFTLPNILISIQEEEYIKLLFHFSSILYPPFNYEYRIS